MSTTFQMTLPDHWYDLSIADETSENTVAGQVWDQYTQAGIDDQIIGQFTESVRRAVRHARRSGALHAGGTFELYEDGPLVATVVVSVVTPPSGGDILRALMAAEPESGVDTWSRVTTAQLQGIGTAGRVHGIQDVTMDGLTMRCAVMHTVVKVPSSSQVLVVTGTSPNIAEADGLFELFDTITGTLVLS
ncbi:hypothetical protein [Kibdelosporangium aridum]|uniref:hypothetical protein n=1 Tax=Kibdelosporangium aridum TaxID=2030 RepID=UPI00068AB604